MQRLLAVGACILFPMLVHAATTEVTKQGRSTGAQWAPVLPVIEQSTLFDRGVGPDPGKLFDFVMLASETAIVTNDPLGIGLIWGAEFDKIQIDFRRDYQSLSSRIASQTSFQRQEASKIYKVPTPTSATGMLVFALLLVMRRSQPGRQTQPLYNRRRLRWQYARQT